jgi:predicted ATPase
LLIRTLTAYAIMVPLLIAAHTAAARAEIRLEGTASKVHVDARDASVADVLAALTERFGLRVRGKVVDRRISEEFDGSMRQVIARVLNGYDYIIQTRDDRLEVTVLRTSSSQAVPAPIYAPPTYPAAKLRRDE